MASIVSNQLQKNGRVLLLGGSGRLSSILRRHWPEAELIVQSRRGADLTFDAMDAQAVAAAAEGMRAVICMAGVVPGKGDLLDNVALGVAACAAQTRVFLASSAAVYGGAGGICHEDKVAPVSDYGRAKLEMEQACAAPHVTALRIGNVAGADAILGGWHPAMAIDQLKNGQTPQRSYIGPVTFTRVLHALTLADDIPAVLNLASPGVVAMGDLLDEAGLAWQARPAPDAVIPRVELDTSRLQSIVGVKPATAQNLVTEWRKDQTV